MYTCIYIYYIYTSYEMRWPSRPCCAVSTPLGLTKIISLSRQGIQRTCFCGGGSLQYLLLGFCLRTRLYTNGCPLRVSDASVSCSRPSSSVHTIHIMYFFYSFNKKVRVSFSPGLDRACRHCWISSFRIPLENGHLLPFF